LLLARIRNGENGGRGKIEDNPLTCKIELKAKRRKSYV